MASKAFSAPHLLFLNTWDGPERDYVSGLFRKAKATGYTRFVEPCAGSFVIPSVAVEAGWTPTQMESSDISLFSTAVGSVFTGRPLAELEVRYDGERVALDGSLSWQAATVLYWELRARTEAKPDGPYWNELRKDLAERQTEHIRDIEKNILKLESRLKGLTYKPLDLWTHIAEVADDPHTIISCNPPTYKAGFERFFNTKGRLTWAQPEYSVWDPVPDSARLMQLMADKPALIILQQQAEPGKNVAAPVYARHLSPGQYIYLMVNRPDEVTGLMGGLRVTPYRAQQPSKLNAPLIPFDYCPTPESRIEVYPVKDQQASYYRDLWLHRIQTAKAAAYLAFVVDGYLAGMAGYDTGPLLRPYPGAREKMAGCLLLSFAVGAPHQQRLTRLITMLALTREAVKTAIAPQFNAMVQTLITAEFTKHPEAKGLRGLMTLVERKKDPKRGHKLLYRTPVVERAYQEQLRQYCDKEAKWQAQRAARATTTSR